MEVIVKHFFFGFYKNTLNGKCVDILIPCTERPAWYLVDDRECKKILLMQKCKSFDLNSLEEYNYSCENYVQKEINLY